MGKNEKEYEVEALIGKRRKKNSGSVEYRVLWKGFPKEQSTWEPEQHLENVQYMIDEFNKKIQERNTTPPKKQVPTIQPTIKPTKKIEQELPLSGQETKRKQVPQKQVKHVTKDSDQESNEQQETVQEPKARGATGIRGRPPGSRIQQEAKSIEKKAVQPIKHPVKPPSSNVEPQSPTNIKRSYPSKVDNQKTTNVEDDLGFSSDEDSNQIFEVTGIFINQNGKYGFSVHEKKNNRRTTLRRRQLIKKDPMALIRFYEKSVNITT